MWGTIPSPLTATAVIPSTPPDFTVRPGPDDYAPFYETYVRLAPDGNILDTLRAQTARTEALLGDLPADLETHSPGPDRWSVREVLGHLVDFERVMAFRALWFARGATDPLGSMEQDDWVPRSGARHRSLGESLHDLRVVRAGTLRLAASLDEAALERRGVASGNRVSVRALFWIMAGHERHHVTILERDYLPSRGLLVVLDMAGTTVAVSDEVPAAFLSACGRFGIPVDEGAVREIRGRSKREAIAELVRIGRPDLADAEAEVNRVHGAFLDELRSRLVPRVAAVPGAAEAVAQLRAAGHRVVLATGFDRTTASAILDRLGWKDAVDDVITGDDVERGRPAPDTVLAAMGRTGITDPERVVVVGDTVSDMASGRSAGVGTTVGVLTGAHDRSALAAVEGVEILPSVAGLPEWLAGR